MLLPKKYYLCFGYYNLNLKLNMKSRIVIILAFVALLGAYALLWADRRGESDLGYVVVTDYVEANSGEDVSDALQKIIDDNPNRTIYFPDGEYLISKPINTPAEPTLSVALHLSNYAVIRAMEGWSHSKAMIRLGGKDEANNIKTPGSNYYLDGGIIDCAGVAKAVSIVSGRETVIRNTSIKGTELGIHVLSGANSGSSDCDISSVNIVGNNSPTSIGVLVDGFDNTFSNMRIGGVHVGFQIRSQANSLRNIHPLYYGSNDGYETSCGFLDEAGNNWYEFCYSDEFASAFTIVNGRRSLYNDCFAYWYSKRGEKHVAFTSVGRFNASVRNMNVGFGTHNAAPQNLVLDVSEGGGKGDFTNLHIENTSVVTNNNYKSYLR